jgi:hypothetical protein
MIDVPAPAIVAVLPLRETTEGEPEPYIKVPGIEAVTVGEISVKAASPYVFVTGSHVNVGEALLTVTTIVDVPPEI